MKRFLTLIVVMFSMLAAMAQSAGIILSYNKGEKLKTFKSNQLREAIEEAEVNDTIYFGCGDYSLDQLDNYSETSSSSYKELNKPMVFIGAGSHNNGTLFRGYNYLYLKADPSLEASKRKYSFEGIYFYNQYDIYPASDLNEIKFVNCDAKFSDVNDKTEEKFTVDNFISDGSLFICLNFSNFSINRINVTNSQVIDHLYGGCNSDGGVATFDHCFFYYVSDDFVGLVQHSFVISNSAGAEASFDNCVYDSNYGGAPMTDCIQNRSSNLQNLNRDPSELGNCNDGTPYGTTGGVRPYSYYPPYPTPDFSVDENTHKPKSFVDYDAINKKLTITVKRVNE